MHRVKPLVLRGACNNADAIKGVTPSPAATISDYSLTPSGTPNSSASPQTINPRSAPFSLPINKKEQAKVVEGFFKGLEALCLPGPANRGPFPEHERFAGSRVLGELAPGRWLLEDGLGTRLIVDTTGRVAGTDPDLFPKQHAEGAWIVYGVDGPRSILERGYTFGCPEEVFVGTLGD